MHRYQKRWSVCASVLMSYIGRHTSSRRISINYLRFTLRFCQFVYSSIMLVSIRHNCYCYFYGPDQRPFCVPSPSWHLWRLYCFHPSFLMTKNGKRRRTMIMITMLSRLPKIAMETIVLTLYSTIGIGTGTVIQDIKMRLIKNWKTSRLHTFCLLFCQWFCKSIRDSAVYNSQYIINTDR